MAVRFLLLTAFFLSGFSTLIYEILWVKHLVYLFGVTYHAITTVVTVFMGGMALGALLVGRLADRSRSPLRLYALLELGLGAWGLLFPGVLALVAGLYHGLHDSLDLGFFSHILVRFVLSTLLLLPPAMAMGATLPALARYFVRSRGTVGVDLSGLYGINTLGAALGCALCGFVLMVELGLAKSALVAVAQNVAAAGAALLLYAWEARGPGGRTENRTSPVLEAGETPESESDSVHESVLNRRLLLGLFFVSGFTSLGYELLWTRIAALLHPNAHTHVFALVLTLYLAGMGLGSALYGWGPVRRLRPLALYGGLQLVVGVTALLAPFAFMGLKRILGDAWYLAWEPAREHLDLYLSGPEMGLLCGVVGVPALCFGALFPLCSRLYVERFSRLGTRVGAAYFAVTAGGITGSFCTGFLLMPALSARGSLLGLCAINLGIGLLLLMPWSARDSRPRRWAIALCGLVAGSVSALAMALTPPWVFINVPVPHAVAFYRDGRSTTDAVIRVRQQGRFETMLFANGEFVSSGPIGLWLPLRLHAGPHRIMILAFDTGATSAEALRSPRVREVEAVDISDVQPIIASYFLGPADRLFEDPRFSLTSNDGRNHLLTRREGYDVIWNGVAAYSGYLELSTVEFFRLCRSRLRPGGLYLHKLHPHMLTTLGFRRVLGTFLAAFPRATLWQDRVSSVLLLVGHTDGRRPDLSRLPHTAPTGERDPDPHLDAAMFLTDEHGLRALSRGAAILKDDHPPRLSRTLTLIDTGSDFLAEQPINQPRRVYEREILALIQGQQREPDAVFSGLSAADRRRIHALRARRPPGPSPGPAPGPPSPGPAPGPPSPGPPSPGPRLSPERPAQGGPLPPGPDRPAVPAPRPHP